MRVAAVISVLVAVAAGECNSTRTAMDIARSAFRYNDSCDGLPCLVRSNCESGICSNSPTMDAYYTWLSGYDPFSNGTQAEPPIGTCGAVASPSGMGTGTVIAIIAGVGIVLALAIGGAIYYKKKRKALQS